MGEESLGHMIKRGRESLGFSQARLGELVGRSASTIRNWERGKSTPSAASDAVALAAVLGLDERRVVEAAGFEMADVDSHQTVEQAYASLAPQGPEPAEAETEAEATDRQSDEEEAEVAGQGPAEVPRPPPAKSERSPEGTSQPSPERAEAPRRSAPGPPARERRLIAVPADRDDRVDTADRDEEEAGSEEEEPVSRAAPPTVLETTPEVEPSYLEDPDERQRYRARALATAALVVFMLIVLLWSFDRAVDALGTMWEDFTGMLEL